MFDAEEIRAFNAPPIMKSLTTRPKGFTTADDKNPFNLASEDKAEALTMIVKGDQFSRPIRLIRRGSSYTGSNSDSKSISTPSNLRKFSILKKQLDKKPMSRKPTVKTPKQSSAFNSRQSQIFKSAKASQETPLKDSIGKRLDIKIEEEDVDEDYQSFDRLLRKAASSNQMLNDDNLRVMRATQVVVDAHISPTNLKEPKRKTIHAKLLPSDIGFSSKYRCSASGRPSIPMPDDELAVQENEATLRMWLQNSPNTKSSDDKPSND